MSRDLEIEDAEKQKTLIELALTTVLDGGAIFLLWLLDADVIVFPLVLVAILFQDRFITALAHKLYFDKKLQQINAKYPLEDDG